MRPLWLVVVVACGSSEPPSAVPARPIIRDAAVIAPGIDAAPPPAAEPALRLPEGVTPLSYDLRLEVSSSDDAFAGTVSIRVRLDGPTKVIWLHAQDLAITRAHTAAGPIQLLPPRPHDLQPLQLARTEGPGEVTLELAYTGKATKDQEGLFRQRGVLYSQAEAAFARRIVPCFDEPRFKVPWRVTLVTPARDVALANAPSAREQILPDGRREVVFAEIDALPSYLLAIAVGKLTLVDGGRVGRGKIRLRIAVPGADAKRAAFAVMTTGKIVDVLERYFDQPLPLAKLDLVAVPELFGAMEHPGLITFSSEILLGDPSDRDYRRRFLRVCAHELAHQWTGNLVTMAWWDDLWLAEAFATFLGDKAAAELGAFDDEALRMQIDREDALAADAEPAPSALHRTIAAGDDLDETFDAIAYEKGRAVLVTFERYVGADVFRTALRAYVAAHARRNATTADFTAALAGASSPEVGRALVSLVEHAGTPVVELSVRCRGTPVIAAHARDGVTVPVCVRYPGAKQVARACALVGDRAEIALPEAASCPAWLVGNESGLGYYEIAWPVPPSPPLGVATPGERLAFADDIAGSVRRSDVGARAAATSIQQLVATGDAYSVLGSVAIAAAIDPLISDADRPAWTTWLGQTFAAQLTVKAMLGPRTPVEYARRDALLSIIPGSALDPALVRRARAVLDRELRARSRDAGMVGLTLQLSGHTGGKKLWAAIERIVLAAGDEDVTAALLEGAPVLGPELTPAIFTAIQRAPIGDAIRVAALLALAQHHATRDATWKLLKPALANIVHLLHPAEARELVEGLGATCSATIRDDLPAAAAGLDSPETLGRARAELDRCLARRAAAGPLRLPPD